MEQVKIVSESFIKKFKLTKFITFILFIFCCYLTYINIELTSIIKDKNTTITDLKIENKKIISQSNYTINILTELISKQHETNIKINNILVRERSKNIIFNCRFQIGAFLYKHYPNMNKSYKNEIINAFVNHQNENIPILLIASICQRESNFDKKAIGKTLPSGKRAKGLCQIHPLYWMDKIKQIGYNSENDLFIPHANIYASMQAFKYFYNQENDIFNTLYGYVGGQHHTYVKDVLNKFIDTKLWLHNLKNDEIQKIIKWINE